MKNNLNTAGYVRLVIYVLAALAGVAAVVVNSLGFSDLGVLIGTVAGAGAAVTGGTATYNLPKAPDQGKTGGFDLDALSPAIMEIAEAARAYRGEVSYEPRHAADEAASEAAVERGTMADYAASVRGE